MLNIPSAFGGFYKFVLYFTLTEEDHIMWLHAHCK